MLRRVLVLSLVALLAVAVSVHAIDPPSGAGIITPNYAYVQMQMVEISKIDGVEQAFHADFFMLTSWTAPLVAPFTGSPGESLDSATLQANFWAPGLEFINARSEITRLVAEPFGFNNGPPFGLDNLALIRPGYSVPSGWAWIVEDQRYQCDFTTPLKMQDFPFDTQYMEFLIESFWDSGQVIIVYAKPNEIDGLLPPGMKLDNGIVGWQFEGSIQFRTNKPYEYNGRDYSRLVIRTKLKRQPEYYMTKIVAGAFLLVYMCIWVFSLAVDEADRMMGTLQIFAGLITFLFVAGGDTPKVPYQTRLDLFMLWSFFNVAFILVIHGTLYYWRECDVEDLLEERAAEKEIQRKEEQEAGKSASHAEVELGAVASPSAAGSPAVRVYVNDPAGAAAAAQHHIPTTWRLREDEWSDFTLSKWFHVVLAGDFNLDCGSTRYFRLLHQLQGLNLGMHDLFACGEEKSYERREMHVGEVEEQVSEEEDEEEEEEIVVVKSKQRKNGKAQPATKQQQQQQKQQQKQPPPPQQKSSSLPSSSLSTSPPRPSPSPVTPLSLAWNEWHADRGNGREKYCRDSLMGSYAPAVNQRKKIQWPATFGLLTKGHAEKHAAETALELKREHYEQFLTHDTLLGSHSTHDYIFSSCAAVNQDVQPFLTEEAKRFFSAGEEALKAGKGVPEHPNRPFTQLSDHCGLVATLLLPEEEGRKQ